MNAAQRADFVDRYGWDLLRYIENTADDIVRDADGRGYCDIWVSCDFDMEGVVGGLRLMGFKIEESAGSASTLIVTW